MEVHHSGMFAFLCLELCLVKMKLGIWLKIINLFNRAVSVNANQAHERVVCTSWVGAYVEWVLSMIQKTFLFLFLCFWRLRISSRPWAGAAGACEHAAHAGGWPADEQERFRERWTQEKLRSSVIHLLPEWSIMGVSRRNADQHVGKYKWIKPRSSSTNKHQTNSNYTRVKTAQNVISALQKTIRFSQAQKSKQSPKSPKLSFLCLTFQLVMCNYYNIMMFARQICVPETQLSTNTHNYKLFAKIYSQYLISWTIDIKVYRHTTLQLC